MNENKVIPLDKRLTIRMFACLHMIDLIATGLWYIPQSLFTCDLLKNIHMHFKIRAH